FLKIVLVVFLFFASFEAASASFISITTDIKGVDLDAGHGTSNLRVVNRGDEAAFDTSVSFYLPEGFTAEEVFIGRLNPNQPFESEISVEAPAEALPGVYPAAASVNYRDANSYPFSAVTPFYITVGRQSTTAVFAVLDEATVSEGRGAKLRLTVKNPDSTGRNAFVTLYLPRELEAEEYSKELFLPARGNVERDFEVSSFSALPGSSYAVFAGISFEENNIMHSTFARGTIRVVEEQPIVSNNMIKAVLAVLVLLFLALQLRRKG
ncbi:MAG TPA: hypothetical protein ENH13_07470, partial [Euryarchaeota archaeon]|nr:hypothetical protein [Euryarchaeota archaeon]